MTQHNHRNAMPVNKTDKPGFASVLFTWLLPYLTCVEMLTARHIIYIILKMYYIVLWKK